MKCAPTFGAVPSAEDLKKKAEEAAEVADKKDEIVAQLMSKDALARLYQIETAKVLYATS